MIVALIALVGAWGGPAVAQSLIGSREVKNNSLTTHDIRDRSLTGADMKGNTLTGRVVSGLSTRDIRPDGLDGFAIDESSLTEVPHAATAARAEAADTAASATTAHQLAGARVVRVGYARLANAETTTLFDEGGLRITAKCTGNGVLDIRAIPTGTGGGLVRVTTSRPNGGTAAAATIATDNDFREGDTVNLLDGGADNLAGTLAWTAPTGDIVTIDYLSQDGLGAARGYQCLLAGTAVHTTP